VKRTLEQLQAIGTDSKRVCVDAGAGSGKTSVLVERMVHLLAERDAPLDSIVAITFTDKAAGEMKARLRKECRARAAHDDSATMSIWRDIERRLDSARISTIHAFCMALLKENALRLGMDPDFALLGDGEGYLLRADVIEVVVHRALEGGDEAARRLAVEYDLPVIHDMLHSLLRQRADVHACLEDEAYRYPDTLRVKWGEVSRHLRDVRLLALSKSPRIVEAVTTLEAIAGQASDATDKREQLRVGLLAILMQVREADSVDTVERALRGVDALQARGGSKKKWATSEAFDAVLVECKRLRELAKYVLPPDTEPDIECRAAQCTCDLVALYGLLVAALDAEKEIRASYDFDDLILRAATVLRDDESVRARTARGIRFLLIDEFQDTDPVQLEIAQLLAGQVGGPELFVVGDAKQSIYHFRGADVGVFTQERDESEEVVPLNRNFRTVPDVLNFANDFFEKSGLLAAVEQPYVPLQPNRKPHNEAGIEWLLPDTTVLAAKPTSVELRALEADLIAARLKAVCEGEAPLSIRDPEDDELRPVRYGDMAILLRAFSDVSVYERSLREAGIPYTVQAGTGFYERQEVLDFRNFLSVIVNPYDESALLAFLRGPIVGVSDENLYHLCRDEPLSSAFHREQTPDEFAQASELERARVLLADLQARVAWPLARFVRHALDRSGLEAIVLPQFLGAQKASNLRKVLALAETFGVSQSPTLRTFLRYLDEIAATAIREGEAALHDEGGDAVQIMTIHKAKGLEFPLVVLPDIARDFKGGRASNIALYPQQGMALKVADSVGEPQAPGMFTELNKTRQDAEYAEFARVLYVAMTRARDYLLLAAAPKSVKPERLRPNWYEVFERCYSLGERMDGAAIMGDGWRARVIRSFDAGVQTAGGDAIDDHSPNVEALWQQVAPIGFSRGKRLSISVSGLLEAMTPTQPKGSGGGQSSQVLVDPLLRGNAVHAMMEHWFDSKNEAIAAALRGFDTSIHTRRELENTLKATADSLETLPVCAAFTDTAPDRREVPFSLDVGGVIVHGTIDGLLDDGSILDFKTGRRKAEAHTRYEDQVRLYAAAVRAIGDQDPPRAYLVYVDAPEAIEVDVSVERCDEAITRAVHVLGGQA
jgi:ATP-dependent helicase/nuclease subunit A